ITPFIIGVFPVPFAPCTAVNMAPKCRSREPHPSAPRGKYWNDRSLTLIVADPRLDPFLVPCELPDKEAEIVRLARSAVKMMLALLRQRDFATRIRRYGRQLCSL